MTSDTLTSVRKEDDKCSAKKRQTNICSLRRRCWGRSSGFCGASAKRETCERKERSFFFFPPPACLVLRAHASKPIWINALKYANSAGNNIYFYSKLSVSADVPLILKESLYHNLSRSFLGKANVGSFSKEETAVFIFLAATLLAH